MPDLPPYSILTCPTSGLGVIKGLFQPLTTSGSASVQSLTGTPTGSGGSVNPSPVSGFQLNIGWIWTVGPRPVFKTRRVIGGANGTCCFMRTTDTLDQFYFVGPATSTVSLLPVPTAHGTPSTAINSTSPYAECSGSTITVRTLDPSNQADADFLALVAQAQALAIANGLGTA